MRVERSPIQSGFTLVDYTAHVTHSHGEEADLRHLIMLSHHLATYLELDNASFALRWRSNGFEITAPIDSRAHQALEHFCTESYSRNARWFSKQPYGPEPNYTRRHHELVGTPEGTKIVTYISGPGSDGWNSNVLNNNYVPYDWRLAGFHL